MTLTLTLTLTTLLAIGYLPLAFGSFPTLTMTLTMTGSESFQLIERSESCGEPYSIKGDWCLLIELDRINLPLGRGYPHSLGNSIQHSKYLLT